MTYAAKKRTWYAVQMEYCQIGLTIWSMRCWLFKKVELLKWIMCGGHSVIHCAKFRGAGVLHIVIGVKMLILLGNLG